MTLAPLRASVLAEAEAEAVRLRREADAGAAERVAQARREAEALIAKSRLEGKQAAMREVIRRRAAAARHARELRLGARRVLFDELRSRARETALALRFDPRYGELVDRLEQAAISQLGTGARLERDPPEVGGLRARSGAISVDYTLPALAERALRALGDRLEELWQ